jgi:hypothetical protein
MKETKMKATHPKARKTTKKPSHSSGKSPLDQRLLAYALGGGALALAATPADAAVIRSNLQNIEVVSTGPTPSSANFTSVNLVPGDGTSPTFKFGWFPEGNGSGVQLESVVQSVQPGNFAFVESGLGSLKNFAEGQTVGPLGDQNYPKYATGSYAAFYAANGDWSGNYAQGSNWSAGGSGYAGFNFLDANSQTHYGWMELTVPTTSANGEKATLVQWAWESDANTPITISPGSASVPEIDPASCGSALALLGGGLALVEQQLGFAAGAAGLRAWRKRRQAVA